METGIEETGDVEANTEAVDEGIGNVEAGNKGTEDVEAVA